MQSDAADAVDGQPLFDLVGQVRGGPDDGDDVGCERRSGPLVELCESFTRFATRVAEDDEQIHQRDRGIIGLASGGVVRLGDGGDGAHGVVDVTRGDEPEVGDATDHR